MNAAVGIRAPQGWFVFSLFLILIGLAHLGAEWRAARDAELLAALETRSAEAWKGQRGEFPISHTVVYYRIIFTIRVTTGLVTAALLRHYPELAPALRGVDNPFAPWKHIQESRVYQPYENRVRYAG